jgi:predicted site-specific integrase-resolvase
MVRGTSGTSPPSPAPEQVAISARVWAAEKRPHLERQAERVSTDRAAQGYPAHQGINEIGSGVNEIRPTFMQVLAAPTFQVVVVERQARASSLGFRFLGTLLEQQGQRIEVVNLGEDGCES